MTPRPETSEVVPGALVDDAAIPPWLRALTGNVTAVSDSVNNRGGDRTRIAAMLMSGTKRRTAAVLVLFAGSWDADPDYPGGLPADVEVLLLQRASTLRQHSGQVAFPGGAHDVGESFPVDTALREATEETALDPAGVDVLATLPSFPVPPSGFDVVPVIGYWRNPSDVHAVDPAETAHVARVNLRELLSARSRFQVQRKVLGGSVYKGPAFMVDGLLVWGFTGGLIAAISDAAGWDVPWDHSDVRQLDAAIAAAERSAGVEGSPR
ncbi:CoA pyrophosphatase [Gordonia sp. TBRC 11910]|uniref:CoA pyrophosphatase n=1 Tax=Gordonia asplenii TaxID=2725283 RepID=A0A848KWD6_9ACTN|nr:CoA pyrophosphatase [Gordonia asplenii]NMO03154.1 CoA pyrophosphatase [Gordonia asplenii]